MCGSRAMNTCRIFSRGSDCLDRRGEERGPAASGCHLFGRLALGKMKRGGGLARRFELCIADVLISFWSLVRRRLP